MTLYSVLLVIYFIFAFAGFNPKDSAKRVVYVLLLLLPSFFLVAFRSTDVGADTYPYCYTYERIVASKSIGEALNGSYMEIGYNFLEFLFGHMKFSYYGFQFVISCFYYLSFSVFFYKYSNNPALSCFLMLSMQGLFGMMNQTRMWLAISILLFSYSFLRNRCFFRFLLFVLLAGLIHVSAVAFLLIYPFSSLYKKRKSIIITISLLAGFIIAVFGQKFFSLVFNLIGRYEAYSDSDNYGINLASIIFFVEYLAIFVYVYQKNKRFIRLPLLPRKVTEEILSTKSLYEAICLLVLVISLAGITNSFITRVVGFFGVYLYVIFGNSISKQSPKSNLTLPFMASTFLMAAQMFVILVFRSNWDGVVPYEFYF